jgi:hypothetical protein
MLQNMFDIVDYAIKTKRFVGGLGRLKKDGSIVKINGQIFKRSITRDGEVVILIDNFLGKVRKGDKKRWQLVLLKNLVALNENKWRHTRAA